LLERCADVNVVDESGKTALAYALEKKYMAAARLLRFGPNIETRDVKLLLENIGADINAKLGPGALPLPPRTVLEI
jgi:ankyrin repeat protein